MEPFCISETREGESTTTKPMSARLFGCGDHLGFRRDHHKGGRLVSCFSCFCPRPCITECNFVSSHLRYNIVSYDQSCLSQSPPFKTSLRLVAPILLVPFAHSSTG